MLDVLALGMLVIVFLALIVGMAVFGAYAITAGFQLVEDDESRR